MHALQVQGRAPVALGSAPVSRSRVTARGMHLSAPGILRQMALRGERCI